MAKQGQRAEVNTFVQGLITEASPLNFPPNASKQEENFELFRDGTRRRRKGIDFISDTILRGITNFGLGVYTEPAFNAFIWKSAGGIYGADFIVIQAGNVIDIWDTSYGFIQTFTLAPDNRGNFKYDFASVEGLLLVVCGTPDPLDPFFGQSVVTYTYNGPGSSPMFTEGNVVLKVRDLWGVNTRVTNTENDIYFRDGAIQGGHVYNLYNQSWGIPRKNEAGALVEPLGIYNLEYTLWPSNSEVVWTGLQFQPVSSTTTPFERIYPNLYSEVFGLQPLAAKGYFVIDALSRGTSREAEYTRNYNNFGAILFSPSVIASFDMPQDTTKGGATVVTGFAGRAWFAGFQGDVYDADSRSPRLNSHILFSQVIKNVKEIPKCYQEGDPTSREGSDIVDTDGGFIKITEMNKVLAMEAIGSNLVVLADNGIWAITGGSEYGFTATNYKVSKISNFGCVSQGSVVLQGESIFYWGEGGIYIVTTDKTTGFLVVNSLSQSTIQSLYDDIPKSSLPNVQGIYDDFVKKARWVFKTGTKFTSNSETKELVFDFDLGNFSLNTIKNAPDFSVELQTPYYVNNQTRYIVHKKGVGVNGQYTFCDYSNNQFLDWKTNDGIGVDAKAFVLTGSQIAGDSAVEKQAPYIVIHFERTETGTDSNGDFLNPSGCLFRVSWDWAQDVSTNKITALKQAYRYRIPYITDPDTISNNGFEVVSTRNKVRGRGKALALYMETEPGKDCHILGWNITLNGNPVA